MLSTQQIIFFSPPPHFFRKPIPVLLSEGVEVDFLVFFGSSAVAVGAEV